MTVVGTSYSNTTGSGGTYTITGVPAETYSVTASKTGYESDPRTGIVVTAGAITSNVDFTLTAVVGDATPPSITNLSPVDGSTIGTGTPTISASYADPSGINATSVVLKVDNVDVTGNATITVSGVSYTPAAALSESEHTVYLEVKDASNNSNAANKTWSFTVDTEPPVIIHIPVTSGTADEKITITATITDINLTAVSVFYRKTGETYVGISMLKEGDTYSADIPASAVTTAGVEYYIWAKDGAGNEATNGTATLPHSVSVSAPPPTKGNISGTVTDKDGKPLSGVTVTAGGSSDTTDANGDYTITGLSAGTYTVTASKSGYKSSTQSITVTAGADTPNVDFTLEKKAEGKPGFIPSIGMIGTTLALLGAALIIHRKRRK